MWNLVVWFGNKNMGMWVGKNKKNWLVPPGGMVKIN